jgi:hypothetical protein
MAAETPSTLERWLKISGVALTLVGLLAGTYQFTRNQAVDAARPFLERKLKWCEEAVEVAAGIAVHGRDSSTLAAAPAPPSLRRVDRFWALYWGVMGIVENQDVTDAMIAFGEGLRSGTADSDKSRALAIAHACRREMARDWSPVWRR